MAIIAYHTGVSLNIVGTVQMSNGGLIMYLRTGTGANIAENTVVSVHWMFKKVA